MIGQKQIVTTNLIKSAEMLADRTKKPQHVYRRSDGGVEVLAELPPNTRDSDVLYTATPAS